MADVTLFVRGTVLTMEPEQPVAEALAVRDGRVAAVGSSAEILRLRETEPGATVVDLGGRCLLPGFVDAHAHFSLAVLDGFWADCRTPPLRTIPELQAALRRAAAVAPAGAWVRGYGYHHAALAERRHPTRGELDEAVPDRPAVLLHFSHHQAVANSRALAAAGITRATPDPPGGEIGRDRTGEPNGLLFERAMAVVERASREGWEARFVEAAAAASRRFAAVGLTTVQDAAVEPALERRYREAEAAGQLAIRVLRFRVSPAGWFHPPWDEAGGPGEGHTLKVFVDGGYRCAMRLPREGGEVRSGFLFYRREELAEGLVRAWRSGWSVACHAIGNLGVETCLDALEDALRVEPAGAGRIRVEHALFLTPALIARLRALGVPVVVQPAFLYDGLGRGPRLPADLRPMPFGSLRAAGVPLAFSSDYPCGTLAPLAGIFAAVTRQSRDGEPGDPAEVLPVAAALKAYTIGAARAARLAAECGSLAPGKRADLVLLDANPLRVAPEALRNLRVLETWVAGRLVWP